ncbi:hypothetical protein [Rhodococcus sp. ACS1]|uniref:hypothetical protein n=1 Tax=Rhodococcus sp. ACS1 TaxID=2028570 RepID=UPI001C528B5C|nr:hypothetical protein [Rhodococcus sp. ACS1]
MSSLRGERPNAPSPGSPATGYRRMTIRYERHGEHFAGFLHLAAALTCFKKLPT